MGALAFYDKRTAFLALLGFIKIRILVLICATCYNSSHVRASTSEWSTKP